MMSCEAKLRQEGYMPVDIIERVLLYESLGASVCTPNWLIQSHTIFCQSLLDRAYPCYLGTAAEKLGELLVTYIEGDNREHLPRTLATFLRISAAHPDQRYVLALFYKPEVEPRSLEYYKTKFWDLLQFLHDRSEERRVGKECRSRWSAYHYKKNKEVGRVNSG